MDKESDCEKTRVDGDFIDEVLQAIVLKLKFETPKWRLLKCLKPSTSDFRVCEL